MFHRDDYSQLSWVWKYRSKRESVGIFNEDGDLLGFVLILGHSRSLKFIGIHPKFQGLNLGSILLNHCLKTCMQDGSSLNLIPANTIVQAWYQRHGFYITRYFPSTNGTDGIIMNYHSKNTRSGVVSGRSKAD